jgi:thioredoxin reductase (NADPH)
MSDTGRKIQLFGTRGSADAYAIRDFLHRCDQPFDWIELNNDQQAHAEGQVTGLSDKRLPICVFLILGWGPPQVRSDD